MATFRYLGGLPLLLIVSPAGGAFSTIAVSTHRPEAARAVPPSLVVEVNPTPTEPPALSSKVVAGVDRTDNADIGVLLLNLGGPDTLDDVEPFLFNLFSDPEIITLPDFAKFLNGPVAWIISSTRAPQT